MTIDLKRYETLKGNVDRLQRDVDRAEGALAQLTERLRTEFGCGTLEEAERKLKQLEKESAESEKMYAEALRQFEEEWAEVTTKEE